MKSVFINSRIRNKFLLPVVILTIVCCIVVLVFSVLLINRIQNNYTYLFCEMLILLAILTACVFLVKHTTGSLMKEVLSAKETALKATEEKNMFIHIDEIMNGLDVMIFVTDPKTNEIIFMNEFMKRHYGVDGDPSGRKCHSILKKRRDDKRCSFCPCYKLDKDPSQTIVWDEHSAVTNCTYRRVDRYIKWESGETVHIQYSVDMTELIAAKEAAELSSRSKGIFLAHMSHEIRTPMNAILGISEIQLNKKNLSAAEAIEGYRDIYESGKLLLNIINDILDFSKIDAGKLEIISETYDIPSLIVDAVQLNRLRYENKPIDFIVDLDENTPHNLIGDELRIKQILNNILSNAFKYTETGEVELSVSSEEGHDNETVTLIFRIRDTGQGMKEDQIARIFDEYSRFNLETNRSVPGTGLGMGITKHLIDMMDGEISIDSTPDKGSEFTVRLPQVRCGSAVCGLEVSEKIRGFNLRNISSRKNLQIIYEHMPYGRVLVVDDVKSNLLVAEGLLSLYGLHIETANSGFDAIEKIEDDKKYDIVFMDHMMPGMDGVQTTKILRDMGYTDPIVALTANAVVGNEKMFIQNGFDRFISKPINSQELDLLLNELIRDKQPPGVIEEAQRKKTHSTSLTHELAVAAAYDIENALAVLEELIPGINTGDADMNLFTTTVHGIKSALANIGEIQLSSAARRLELAAKYGDTAILSEETPEFMDTLRPFVEKIRLPTHSLQTETDDNGEISRDGMVFIQDRFDEIKAACEKFDIMEAKAALGGLKQKTWPQEVNNYINEISLYLVRGECEKVVSSIDRAVDYLG